MEEFKQKIKGKTIDKFALELCREVVDSNTEKSTDSIEKTEVPDKQNRTKLLQFRVSEEEYEKINKRFEKSYSKSLSEFLRISALSCVNMIVDNELFTEYNRKISGIANNLNQIAVRANSMSNIYAEDVQEIKEEAQQIWQLQISILSELHSVNQFSISLTETKPETASLLLAVAVYLMHKEQQNNSLKSEPAEQEKAPF